MKSDKFSTTERVCLAIAAAFVIIAVIILGLAAWELWRYFDMVL